MATPGARPALALLLALLEALLPGSGGAQVSVTLKDAILPPGGSTEVNCSATCDQVTNLGLETKLTKRLVAQGDAWKVFELRDVQDDSIVQCFANCDEGQLEASDNLTVYRLPERVELAPLPPWQPVGDTFTLRCRVSGGAPRTHLTVVLLRGQEELSRQPAEGEPAEVTATVSASREDHDANFSCRTDLDLRSQGLKVFQNSSTSWKLQTFALPVTSPLLSAPHILEVGENPMVSCSLDGVFPTWEAKVYIALGDQLQNASVASDGDMLTATATLKADPMEGPQNLKCAVTLGNQTREKNQTVTVYSFPAPSLTLSELVVSEGTEVTVVCEARAATVVTLTGAPAPVPTQTSASRAEFHLNASAQDNGRHFFCSAALRLHGQVLYKNQTQELQVLYGPRLNEEDCPGNWTWQEGSEKTLKCQAWGNPSPKLDCYRKGDNFSLPIGDLKPVKREFAGTYLCRAVSTRGEVTRQVVMNVLYHQDNLAIIITVTAIVILGTVATAGYLYNRQRKIRIYRLKQAQEEASLKMNPPP